MLWDSPFSQLIILSQRYRNKRPLELCVIAECVPAECRWPFGKDGGMPLPLVCVCVFLVWPIFSPLGSETKLGILGISVLAEWLMLSTAAASKKSLRTTRTHTHTQTHTCTRHPLA